MTITNEVITTWLLMGLKAVAILVAGKIVIDLLIKSLRKLLKKNSFDPMLESFALSGLRFILIFVLIMAVLQIFGVETTSLVAILGAASLAIGLALQGNLSNVSSGFMIVLIKPFRVGDFVDAGGHSGAVSEIGIFHTTLHTVDNKKVLIPNSSVASNSIVNYTGQEERRVDIVFDVGYDSNIEHVKSVLNAIIEDHPMTNKEKPIFVRMTAMDTSSLKFTIRVWTETQNYWDLYHDILETAKKQFDKEGIEIPFPHVTVQKRKK